MSEELVAFLRARLDEDEQVARAATRGPWRIDPEGAPHGGDGAADIEADWIETVRLNPDPPYNGALREWRPNVAGDSEGFGACSVADAKHIARHDPARVLAEVQAKRRIIEEHSPVDPCDAHDASLRSVVCETLRLLALPYAGHDLYRAEWAPDTEVTMADGMTTPDLPGDAHLRDGRYCSVHDIDLVPPDRTLRTRRYCPQCPPGSALGFPRWMVEDRD